MIYLKSALAGLGTTAIFLMLLLHAMKSALTGTYFIIFHFNSPVLFFVWLSVSFAYFFVFRRRAKSSST
jgi:hypothetical protein